MTEVAADVVLENRKSSLDSFSRWLLGFSLLVVSGAAITFMLLALPANDDWQRATEPRELGYWQYMGDMYMKWQGRWASFGLESALLPLGDMTKTYPLLLAGVAVVNLAGIYFVCRFFTRTGSRWFSLACALGFAALLWAEMPSLAQAFYWFVGNVENTMVLSLAGMLLVGMISMRASIPWMMFASVFAIFTCGFHESIGCVLCIALATGTVTAYWMKSKNRVAWLAVLIAAIIGLGIVVGAPGNRVRMQKDGPKHARDMVAIFRLTAAQLWNSSRAWIFDPKLLAASLWVAFSPRLEASRPVWINANRAPLRLLIPLAWLAMLILIFFLPSYAFGKTMPPRTLSANFIVFATGWLVIVFIWTRTLPSRDAIGTSTLRSVHASAVARLIFACSLVLSGNTLDAIHDLATRSVLRFRDSVEHRYALLRQKGPDDRVLPRLAPPSRLFYGSEIGTDPVGDWHNWPMAHFFHLEKIRVLPLVGEPMPTTSPVIESDPGPPRM
jgi:hypothetical protein